MLLKKCINTPYFTGCYPEISRTNMTSYCFEIWVKIQALNKLFRWYST